MWILWTLSLTSLLVTTTTEAFITVHHPSRTPFTKSPFTLLAKKGKKKKQKKESGFAWASNFSLKPFEAQALRELASTTLASYEGRTGKAIDPDVSVSSKDPPKALWNAPIACVVVGPPVEGIDGANLQYANLAAMEMVDLKADDFESFCPASASIISRKEEPTAPSILLDLPSEMKDKYESGYTKIVFRNDDDDDNENNIRILNAQRWTLEKSSLIDGQFVTTALGTAYAWKEWQVGDSTMASPGGIRKPLVNLEELQTQLDEQAAFIRKLKEEEGLGNQDEKVVEAVQKLLKLKEQIAAVA